MRCCGPEMCLLSGWHTNSKVAFTQNRWGRDTANLFPKLKTDNGLFWEPSWRCLGHSPWGHCKLLGMEGNYHVAGLWAPRIKPPNSGKWLWQAPWTSAQNSLQWQLRKYEDVPNNDSPSRYSHFPLLKDSACKTPNVRCTPAETSGNPGKSWPFIKAFRFVCFFGKSPFKCKLNTGYIHDQI